MRPEISLPDQFPVRVWPRADGEHPELAWNEHPQMTGNEVTDSPSPPLVFGVRDWRGAGEHGVVVALNLEDGTCMRGVADMRDFIKAALTLAQAYGIGNEDL